MKKIVIVTFLFIAALNAQGQTPCAGGLFPSIDSLRSFINVHIRNSAINAFTNLRLNTAMVGVTQWLDCIRDNGMDSISIIDAAGSNPDTIKVYKKGAFAFYKLLPAGGGGGENVTVSNATLSGYKLVKQVSTKDYVVKSILPGVAVRLDSNATGVTVNTDTANLPKTVWREGSNITLNWTAPATAGQPDTVVVSVNTDAITATSFTTVIGPYESINYARSGDSSTITAGTLIGKNIYLLTIDGFTISPLANSSAYYSFNSATGQVTLYNGKFTIGSTVNILFDKQTFAGINIVLDGNSMPNGAQTSDHRSNAIYAVFNENLGVDFPGSNITFHNVSQGNQALFTTSDGAFPTSKIGRFSSVVQPLYVAGKRNIVIIWEDLNELYYSLSKTNVLARKRQYAALARSNGWEVWTVTIAGKTEIANNGYNTLPGNTYDTYNQGIKTAVGIINDSVRAAPTDFADQVIDLAAGVEVSNFPDNSTYPSVDGIHYGDYVSYLQAERLTDSALAILGKTRPNPWYITDNTTALALYKTTAGITNSSEVTDVDWLFGQLSQIGLWQWIDVFYPLLGDDANGWKVNAKQPSTNSLIPINPGGGSDVLSFNKATGLTLAGNARAEIPIKDSTLREGAYGFFFETNKNTSGSTPYIFGTGNNSIQFFGSDVKIASFDGSNTSTKSMDYPTYSTGFFGITRDRVYRRQVVNTSITSAIDQKVALSPSQFGLNLPIGVYYFDATPTIFPATVAVRFATFVKTKRGLPEDKILQLGNIIHEFNTRRGRGYHQIN